MKKVIVFGNQQITIDCINILLEKKNVEVVAVVGCETELDLMQGYPSIRQFCQKINLNYLNPDRLDHQTIDYLKTLKADLGFSIMYRNIFKKEVIELFEMGLVNFHPSLLPFYRGPIPWVWALINGENKTGITMHYIDEGIDTGDIIDQKMVKIREDQTGSALLQQLMKKGVTLFKLNLERLLSGKNLRVKQNHTKASYYGPFNPHVSRINWFEKTKLILRKISAVTKPYNGAIAYVNGIKMIIWKANKYQGPMNVLRGPGRIIDVSESGIVVSVVDGYLLISEYELEKPLSKKEINQLKFFDLT